MAFLCALLAGCGALPKPFDHVLAGVPPPSLSRVPDGGGGVFVTSSADDQGKARDAAQALRKQGLPATFGKEPVVWGYRFVVSAHAETGASVLYAPDGRTLLSLPSSIWETEARLSDAALRIAQAVKKDKDWGGIGDAAAVAASRPGRGEGVVVAAFGQENGSWSEDARAETLAGALAAALRQRGASVIGADEAEETAFVRGSLSLGPAQGTPPLRLVKVEWVVADADGVEVGVVRQENVVPAAALERGFSGLAVMIAQAAADDVMQLLQMF